MNSGVRREVSDALREYLDGQEKGVRKSYLQLMSELADEYGYEAATKAMDMALRNGSINMSDVSILAAKDYRLRDRDTPPEVGPSLEVYDDTLLKPRTAMGGALC